MRTKGVAAIALLVASAVFPMRTGSAQTACDGNFHVVHRIDLGGGSLGRIDFSTSDDGWTIGSEFRSGARQPRSVIFRFDADDTERVAFPKFDRRPALTSIEAVSPDDVWVVGFQSMSDGDTGAFAAHWDGAAWTASKVPRPGRSSFLLDVVALASNDIWAVGMSARSDSADTLVLHYDGSSWQRVESPSPSRRGQLLMAVDASSPVDVWAGGYFGRGRPLVLRYNGFEWERMAIPDRNERLVYDVASSGPADAWVVGGAVIEPATSPFAIHWNGVDWEDPFVPNQRGFELFSGVYADQSGAWAVGARYGRSFTRPRAARWDGSAWTNVAFDGDVRAMTKVTGDGVGGIWATVEGVGSEGLSGIAKACV